MEIKKPKVLIIDDEEYIRDGCGRILERMDIEVHKAEDGISGIELFDKIRPDVVLIDIKMPGISGIDVIEHIEAHDPDVIKIVITGYATVELAVESMKKGAYDFLTKPFTPHDLKLVVKRALDKRELILKTKKLQQEQQRIRENLIALVSHELRAPLAATVQNLDLVINGICGTITDETREIVTRCKIRLKEMLELMNKWFSLATFNVEKLRQSFKEIDLTELLQKVIDREAPLAKEKNVTLILKKKFSNGLNVYGDYVSLLEVFSNIICNGIKYNRVGGVVEICVNNGGDFVEVSVKDTGIGIPKEYHEKIFEEFFRVDGRRNSPIKGSGLGLAIVKKLVEAHNGYIKLNSIEGRGSCFIIALPKIIKDKTYGEDHEK